MNLNPYCFSNGGYGNLQPNSMPVDPRGNFRRMMNPNFPRPEASPNNSFEFTSPYPRMNETHQNYNYNPMAFPQPVFPMTGMNQPSRRPELRYGHPQMKNKNMNRENKKNRMRPRKPKSESGKPIPQKKNLASSSTVIAAAAAAPEASTEDATTTEVITVEKPIPIAGQPSKKFRHPNKTPRPPKKQKEKNLASKSLPQTVVQTLKDSLNQEKMKRESLEKRVESLETAVKKLLYTETMVKTAIDTLNTSKMALDSLAENNQDASSQLKVAKARINQLEAERDQTIRLLQAKADNNGVSFHQSSLGEIAQPIGETRKEEEQGVTAQSVIETVEGMMQKLKTPEGMDESSTDWTIIL